MLCTLSIYTIPNVAKAKGIITANERVVTIEQPPSQLKAKVDEAMKDSRIKDLIKHVFVAKRTKNDVLPMETHDVDLDDVSMHDE